MISIGTLESNIVTHCNKRCAGCSHGSPWAPPYIMSPEVLYRDLMRLKPFCHLKQFWLLGGEPLLHPQICAMLDAARSTGISDEVNVLTNATRLDRMPEEFWTKFNYLRISAYPDLNPKMLEIARDRSKRHNFGLGIDGITKFYKQFAPHPNRDSFYHCPWKERCWTVHDGFLFLCPNAAFFPSRFMDLNPGTDGLALDDTLTESSLKEFLENRTRPFTTCSICECFTEQMEWHECKTELEWIIDSTLKHGWRKQ